MVMAIERQQFSIAPDAALVESVVRGPAFAPSPFPGIRIDRGFSEADFEQATAFRTIVDRVRDRKSRAAILLEAR